MGTQVKSVAKLALFLENVTKKIRSLMVRETAAFKFGEVFFIGAGLGPISALYLCNCSIDFLSLPNFSTFRFCYHGNIFDSFLLSVF